VPADVSLEGARGVTRTRAGLGSGLEMTLPTGSRLKDEIWVNIPVVEPFAASSPYVLQGAPTDGYTIVDERRATRHPVRIPREPRWYSTLTSRDIPMSRVGVLQGTYLGIYVNLVCTFWNYAPPLNCRFCTTGQNVGRAESADKALSDVVETCWAAREESGVTFVHLNGGFQGSRGIAFTEPYVKAIKEEVGLLRCVPPPLAADRRRAEHRSQPRGESRRRGSAGGTARGVLLLRSVEAAGEGRGEADLSAQNATKNVPRSSVIAITALRDGRH
jgi:hypothetical protein